MLRTNERLDAKFGDEENVANLVNNHILKLINQYPDNFKPILTQILTTKAKMVRPSLVEFAFNTLQLQSENPPSFGENPPSAEGVAGLPDGVVDKALLNAMTAIELTHISSLYHDDIIDGDDIRRGVASVNAEFGEAKALIGGDIVFSLALKCLKDLPNEATQILATAFDKMCQGQMIELVEQIYTLDQYLNLIHLKTGALIEAAIELGILVAQSEIPNQVDSDWSKAELEIAAPVARNDAAGEDSPSLFPFGKEGVASSDDGVVLGGNEVDGVVNILREYATNYGYWFQLNDDFDDNDPVLERVGISKTLLNEYEKKCQDNLKSIEELKNN
jgi:geranylgeranyl pyrophosphate synthase